MDLQILPVLKPESGADCNGAAVIYLVAICYSTFLHELKNGSS
jgi:hypothetical protein